MRHLAFCALIACASYAHAATLAVATGRDGSSILFTDERGPCLGEARLAWYVSPVQGAGLLRSGPARSGGVVAGRRPG